LFVRDLFTAPQTGFLFFNDRLMEANKVPFKRVRLMQNARAAGGRRSNRVISG
jgi:hypothetical protein